MRICSAFELRQSRRARACALVSACMRLEMTEKERKDVTSWQVVTFIWHRWCRYPKRMSLLLGAISLLAFVEALFPLLASKLMDAVAAGGQIPTRENFDAAMAVVILMAVQSGLYIVFSQISFRLLIRQSTDCMRDIVTEAFDRVQSFSSSWHADHFAGATMRKISRGMWGYDLYTDMVVTGFLPAMIHMSTVIAVVAFVWPIMGFVMLFFVVAYIGLTIWALQHYLLAPNREHVGSDTELGASVADSVTCNSVVKAFGAEWRESWKVYETVTNWRGKARRAWLRGEDLRLIQSIVVQGMKLAMISLVAWLWFNGQANVSLVTLVLTSYIGLANRLREMAYQLQHLQKSINDVEDVVAFGKAPAEIVDHAVAQPLQVRKGKVSFDQVSFRYANQAERIYEDFNLTIRPGERIALVGKSGSGKSTFLKLLQRLYDVEEGRILIDDQDIAHVTQSSLRQAVSVVQQEPILFHRSLADNIAYAQPEASRREIIRAAKRAQAHDFIRALPDGYDTMVGERGVKLSGGERQRVAIARAILADAPLLVLDEATSSLDSVTEAEVQTAVDELIRGRTAIIIAHRLSTVRNVDRILVFEDGVVVEEGEYDALASKLDGHFHTLHQRQVVGLV